MIIVNLKNIKPMNVDEVLSRLEQKYPGEKEYLQAVKEVLVSIEEVYNAHPEFEKAKCMLTQATECNLTAQLAPIKADFASMHL